MSATQVEKTRENRPIIRTGGFSLLKSTYHGRGRQKELSYNNSMPEELRNISENLQANLITYLDGQPQELIDGVCEIVVKELLYNKSMPKLIVEGREVKRGDWIVVEGDNWEEDGCVVDIDEDEINMFDGKEGWSVKRDEIRRVYFK